MFFDDLDPKMMLLTTILFLILIWVLNDILYKPMFNFMQKRDEGIKDDEAKIQQNNSDAENNETLVSKIYNDARVKAESIRSERVAVVKERCDKMLEEKRNSLNQEHEKFLVELEGKRQAFKKELQEELLGCNNLLSDLVRKI